MAADTRPKKGFKKGLVKVGQTLQRFNLARLIDEMEMDQEVADHLEFINQETQAEVDRKELVHEAASLCRADIVEHLEGFLNEKPGGSYQEWIRDLNPDNVEDDNNIDPRFFVEDSDHRILWNDRVPDRTVEAILVHGDSSGRLVKVDLNDVADQRTVNSTVRVVRKR